MAMTREAYALQSPEKKAADNAARAAGLRKHWAARSPEERKAHAANALAGRLNTPTEPDAEKIERERELNRQRVAAYRARVNAAVPEPEGRPVAHDPYEPATEPLPSDLVAESEWLGLGSAVRLHRSKRKWSQAQLAAILGISPHRLDALERGHVPITYALRAELAEVLGVSVALLQRRIVRKISASSVAVGSMSI